MWSQIINAIIGIWLMAAPGILAYDKAGANSCHIVGPVIATFAIIAFWEATNGVRKFNYPLGAWLVIAPWILGYSSTATIVNDMACGILVILFASFGMKMENTYGGGWKVLWK